LIENADRNDNRRPDGTVRAHVDMGVSPCPVASGGAFVGRQAQIQQEQQQEQQQMRLAQHSLVTSDCRGET
jgi:uncharacterized lipoprotein NlpE involved in copper resistance